MQAEEPKALEVEKRTIRTSLCGKPLSLENQHGIHLGSGRPGWHIECTAMSMDYFGQQFDIHGGGHDLRFPHHEAEIFQGECHTGCSPLVHHWMHNGFVNIDGEKMSKSLGNFWTIRDIVEKIDPYVLRFALVNAHYRNPIDMNEALLKEAQKNQNKVLDIYSKSLKMMDESSSISLPIADITSQDTLSKSLGMLEKLGEGFALAMDDDFNSRNAVAKVLGAIREIQRLLIQKFQSTTKRHLQVMLLIGWRKLQDKFSAFCQLEMLSYQSHKKI